jgi:hypothetical protein
VHQFYTNNLRNKPLKLTKRNIEGSGVVTTQKQCKKTFQESSVVKVRPKNNDKDAIKNASSCLTQTTHVKKGWQKTYINWLVPSFCMKVKKFLLSKTTFQKNELFSWKKIFFKIIKCFKNTTNNMERHLRNIIISTLWPAINKYPSAISYKRLIVSLILT